MPAMSTVAPDIEDVIKQDPEFACVLQTRRRQQLGFELPGIKDFLSKTTAVSLGSYCAVANMFEQLGLRDAAGPFDWMRSDCQGITHLILNGFQDFLEWEGHLQIAGLKVFPTTWGGSFWHHDLNDPQVRETFTRRKDRFLQMRNADLLKLAERMLHRREEVDAKLRGRPCRVNSAVQSSWQAPSAREWLQGAQRGQDLMSDHDSPAAKASLSSTLWRSMGQWRWSPKEPRIFLECRNPQSCLGIPSHTWRHLSYEEMLMAAARAAHEFETP